MRDPVPSPLPRARARDAAAMMTAAFLDDPAFVRVLPDPTHRRAGLRAILSVAIHDSAAAGALRTIDVDGAVAAAAAWQPPGRYPMGWRRKIPAIPRMAVLGARIGGQIRRLAQMGDAIDAHFPEDPVWYLQALAVHPRHQRTGMGGALLREGLARADQDGTDAYLETGAEENVAYYRRFGFHLVDAAAEIFPGGPPMWFLRRPARPPARPLA